MRNQKVKVGIVGATGMVGTEMMRVLEEFQFPVSELRLFASRKTAGTKLEFNGDEIVVEELTKEALRSAKLDFVLFSAGAGVSAEYAPIAAETGATVIDNSSHFRLDADVPLVVPEVNPEDIHLADQRGIIANPNCSTIQMVVCLKALSQLSPLKRVVVSTYQAVSGAGSEAMEELQNQVSNLFNNRETTSDVFPHRIAFNCIPHIDVFYENGMTKEEMKMILESRKILHQSDLRITATAVRVPVFIGHAESVNVDFESAVSVDAARRALESTPGVVVVDEPGEKMYPLQLHCAGRNEIYVGRIRKDESVEHGLHLWIVSDNLRKGAATNAVQIANLFLEG